nr:hypothetical protein [Nanoarchaeum sp.]
MRRLPSQVYNNCIRFENMNEFDIATLVGLHLGDGYVSTWKINFKNKSWIDRKWVLNAGLDYEFAVNVKNLIEKLGFKARIHPKDKIYFVVQSYKLWRLIHKIFPVKKYADTAHIPSKFLDWKLSKYVIKGFFSCDGCISVKKNSNQAYLSLDTISKTLSNQIFKILKKQRFNVKFYYFKNNDIYSVRMFKKLDIKRFMKEVGSLNSKHNLIIAEVG